MSERMRDRIARRAGHALAGRIGGGALLLDEGGDVLEFGSAGADLVARAEIRDPRAWTLLLGGSNGLAEGYVEDYWDSDDPVAVVRLLARNMTRLDRARRILHPALEPARRLARRVARNTRAGARANIAAHYDLGNSLFASFLDRELVYSCAYFPDRGADLDEAQRAKLERICRLLRLREDDHLLEIGTGWGALAVHAAQEHGCRVTTTTISREQRDYAERRVRELGLDGRVTVLARDYRDLEGRFDKLVSIEMIEAVGHQYFRTFFRKCSELLRRDGTMLLQAIVIDDANYRAEKAARTFANTAVFPGGCLPSEELIRRLVSRETDMTPVWGDDITAHYPPTLRQWRDRFNAAAPRLAPLGYDERFRRLWNFYLAFSEAGFRERRIRDLQLLFAKPGAARLEDAATAMPALA
jgi:cyclopropane-fatty-acyl-phospholipid synthase